MNAITSQAELIEAYENVWFIMVEYGEGEETTAHMIQKRDGLGVANRPLAPRKHSGCADVFEEMIADIVMMDKPLATRAKVISQRAYPNPKYTFEDDAGILDTIRSFQCTLG